MPFTIGGATFLAQDLSVRCFDGTHDIFRGFAGVLIAFFGVGFPLLFASLLRRHRAELHKPEIFERLGFLYDGYDTKRGMYFWESIVMVRKAAVVMIGSLVQDAYRQIFASVALLIASLFAQAYFQPYTKRMFNLLECVALVTVAVTQLMSMFFLRSDSLTAQCEGQSDVLVVDAQGTTCAQVREQARSSSITTTVGMVLVNLAYVLFTVLLLVYMWLDETAQADPTGIVANGLRKARFRFGALLTTAAPPGEADKTEVMMSGAGGGKMADSFGGGARGMPSLGGVVINNPLLLRLQSDGAALGSAAGGGASGGAQRAAPGGPGGSSSDAAVGKGGDGAAVVVSARALSTVSSLDIFAARNRRALGAGPKKRLHFAPSLHGADSAAPTFVEADEDRWGDDDAEEDAGVDDAWGVSDDDNERAGGSKA
jgi:hypothetical protein